MKANKKKHTVKRKVDRSPLIPGEAELLARIKKKMDLQKFR